MKRLIILFISIILFLFILISYMVYNDKGYYKDMISNIYKNTDIEKIEYINLYDNKYIVTNDKRIYVLDKEYKIILDLDITKIHMNNKRYEIIYKDDKLMYLSDKIEMNKLVYEYYDIYTYELIDKVFVGG